MKYFILLFLRRLHLPFVILHMQQIIIMNKKNVIVIYRFTGRQGFFYIPKKWCKECDLLVNLVTSTLEKHDLADSVRLTIYPWWLYWYIPLFKFGSFKAPQLVINNKLISAGLVPTEENILDALTTSQ